VHTFEVADQQRLYPIIAKVAGFDDPHRGSGYPLLRLNLGEGLFPSGRLAFRDCARYVLRIPTAFIRTDFILGCYDCAALWVAASGLTNVGYSLSHLASANV
jgi:hypothetical protein